MENKQILITGGAGFIGSHLTDHLLEANNDVTIVDNCSNGRTEWVPDGATFVEQDLTAPDALEGVLTSDIDQVFHLAASKAVNTDSPRDQFEANTQMTYNVLETMTDVGVSNLAYTSTSTVYGEAPRPTPEDYAPLEPISVYGASKLADEGLCSTYAHSHDLTVRTFRFANIVGSRLRGAVIPDFIEKLQENPETLTILGNGRQEKSYMHIDDCIDAMLTVIERADGPLATYNLGTRTTTSVTRIADIVSDEMELQPDYEYTGGDRGWTGDVPKMRLSIEKLDALGWGPTHESDVAVREATRELLTTV
ncbi:NAD-dependent epimerase/dehydratase family protein [Natrinema sp. H-ect4]|uniref:NAD-dependent epimerase/dehydratase family protein n=1 Tax=Natrinema sp. H-ect4 TaxID=3242699 RepID=UPI0035A888AC